MTRGKLSVETVRAIAAGVIIAGLIAETLVVAPLLPLGTDWNYVFGRFDLLWPYAPKSQLLFRNVPWTVLFLPHRWLPLEQGNAINMLLNIIVPFLVIVKLKGGWRAMVLLYTFPLYLLLLWVNNIDWIPALIYLMPEWATVPVAAIKPQAVAGALAIYAKRAWEKERGLGLARMAAPMVVVLAVSVVVWPAWWTGITPPVYNEAINASTFPVMVPLGAWLAWKAWRDNDEFLAATATIFFLPFIGSYSISTVMMVLACKHSKIAVGLWLAVWITFAMRFRPMLF